MANVNARSQRYRDKLRTSGLRQIQLWVPDTRLPGFADECRNQSRRVALADEGDAQLSAMLDAALADIEGWTN